MLSCDSSCFIYGKAQIKINCSVTGRVGNSALVFFEARNTV